MSEIRVRWALAALITVLLPVTGESARGDETSREFPFSPGDVLELDFREGGSALVEGWDQPTAKVTWGDHASGKDVVVRARRGEGRLGIDLAWTEAAGRFRPYTCTIKVPRRADVEFHSGGGGLTLRGLEGTFRGSTGGGALIMSDVAGSALLMTGGGDIEVRDSHLDGELSTGGGEVLVENVVGDVEATSGGGNVRYRNVRGRDGRIRAPGGAEVPEGNENTVLITSVGGAVDIGEALAGAQLSTAGGDVTVRNAARFVSAWTGGGDIRIEVRDGWVAASTGGGNIDVNVTGSFGDGARGIELATGGGDITVTLPPDLSLELDLQVSYTRNSRRDYRIDSDLDVRTKLSGEWDLDQGSPRKYIRGTATIGDGRYRVKIRAVNGDIRLRTTH